jgi:hypothetical protein
MKKHLLFIVVACTSSLCLAQSFSLVKPDPTGTVFTSNSITDLIIENGKAVCYTRGDSALATYDGVNWTYKGYASLGFSGNHSSSKELDIALNGDYWLANFSGLDVVSGNSVTNMTAANSDLRNDYLTDLSIDNNGLIFIGYSNGFGLSMVQNGNWTHKGSFTGNLTPFNSIFNAPFIEVNKQTNDTWILSGDNYHKLNNNTLVTYTGASTSIPSSSAGDVTGMTVTDDGKVWFSLQSNSNDPNKGGLLSFDGTNWAHLNTNNSNIPSNNITAIASYKNQIVFNNYSIDGISVYDGVNFSLFDGTNNTNYPTGANYFVHEMKALSNIVYMGTNSGLFIMELPEIVSVEEPKVNFVSVYPNPSNNLITVSRTSSLSNYEVNFYDITGQLINDQLINLNKGGLNLTYSTEELPSGLYIVKVDANAVTFVKE